MKYYNAEYLKEHAEAPQNKLWPMAEVLGGEDCPLVDALMYDKRITSVYVTDKAPEGAESKTLENFVAWYGRGPFEVATLGPNPFPTSIK